MPKFEVHIPAIDTAGFNFTFRVDAESWTAALKAGMVKLGEQGTHGQNVLVDIQDDNSLHVTDAETGRVFRIRELTDQEAAQAAVKRDARPAPAPRPPPDEAKTVVEPRPRRPSKPQPQPQPQPQPLGIHDQVTRPYPLRGAKPRTRELDVVELEAPVKPVAGPIGRPKAAQKHDEIEQMLAEVFERVQDVYARKDPSEALYYLLDLAMEKIPADAGSVLEADASSGDLRFAAARGPKAAELLAANITVPSGAGIVGFCAHEGVSVALSDVLKDPRYYAAVSAKLNYETKSVLASPMMTHGRTFGCFQLLNKKQSPVFAAHEVGILSYIAHQAALYLNALS
jgi:hypothetical protein